MNYPPPEGARGGIGSFTNLVITHVTQFDIFLVVNEHITDTPRFMPETRPSLGVRVAQLYLLEMPNSNP